MLAKSIAAFVTLAISLSGMAYAHGSHATSHGSSQQYRRSFDFEEALATRDVDDGVFARDLLSQISTRDLIDELATRSLESKLRRRGGASSTLKAFHCSFCGASFHDKKSLVNHHNSRHAKDYGTMSMHD